MVEFLIILAILAVVAYAVTAPLRRAGRARPGDAESSPANGAGARANGSEVAGLEAGLEAGGEAGSGAEVAELRSARAEIADLEAAREAKYREIRDAELDRRTGKLSDSDYEATDRTLRAEAIAILNELDRRRGEE